jgi:ABC-type glycerol-3-phosphate transport system permease component
MATKTIRETRSDRIFTISNYIILTLFLLTILYPLVYIVSASMSAPQAVSSGRVWLWPVDLNFAGYEAIFQYRSIMTGFLNSLFYATVGTAINVTFTLLAAYRRGLFPWPADGAVWWWSNDAQSSFPECGPGAICYVDGGARHSKGTWPTGDGPFFEGPCDSGG